MKLIRTFLCYFDGFRFHQRDIPARTVDLGVPAGSSRCLARSVGQLWPVFWVPEDWGRDPERSRWAGRLGCGPPGRCLARAPRSHAAAPISLEFEETRVYGRASRAGGCGSGCLTDSGWELGSCE
jgi:hypothetical protein